MYNDLEDQTRCAKLCTFSSWIGTYCVQQCKRRFNIIFRCIRRNRFTGRKSTGGRELERGRINGTVRYCITCNFRCIKISVPETCQVSGFSILTACYKARTRSAPDYNHKPVVTADELREGRHGQKLEKDKKEKKKKNKRKKKYKLQII